MANPNPTNITHEMWWFWEQLAALSPGSLNAGIYNGNTYGYHNSRDRVVQMYGWNDYSVRDAVDREGQGNKASALDWTFPNAQSGNYSTISLFSSRLMNSSLDSNDPRLDYLREWYGNTDWDNQVEGYDTRYNYPVTSDSSHLWHIHFSFTRKYTASMDAMIAVLSVLKGETVDQWRGAIAPEEDEDNVSFAGIPIKMGEGTSFNLPPVAAGVADPRPCWLNIGNDSYDNDYAVRIAIGDGSGGFAVKEEKLVLESGVVWSLFLPTGVRIISIKRVPVVEGGPIYDGDLTFCVERGKRIE